MTPAEIIKKIEKDWRDSVKARIRKRIEELEALK